MKLPTIDTYAFPVVLPSTGKQIALRPFLVREEKLLLMAKESGNPDDEVEAVGQVIRNCTAHDALDPRTMPYFDAEYLLLQLRIRSVGEIVEPVYRCNNLIPSSAGDAAPCGNMMKLRVNLTDVKVTGLPTTNEALTVVVSSKFTLTLRYPSIYTITALLRDIDSGGLLVNAVNGVVDIFDTLTDTEENVVYKFDDYTTDERMEFLDSLDPLTYQKFVEFIGNMPAVTHSVEHICERCQFHHTITFTGLSDFLL